MTRSIGGIDLVSATIAATGTLLVYDYLFVTFEREVTLVWSQKWTWGKVMFMLNRYLPFIDTFLSLHLLTTENSGSECLNGFIAVTWLILFGIIIAEVILMMRTYAIWALKRSIYIGLATIALVLYIPAIVITEIEVRSYAYAGSPNGCVKTKSSSKIIFLAFVLLVISETVIVVLTVVRVWKLMRRGRSRLLVTMYHDGLIYYIYLLGMSVINLIIPLAAPPDFSNWLTTPQRVLHSILCTRVLLHIRAGNLEPDMLVSHTQVDLSFAAVQSSETATTQSGRLDDLENPPIELKGLKGVAKGKKPADTLSSEPESVKTMEGMTKQGLKAERRS
ncbi:hypothetical protein BD410DRAFT_787230 [Rickenella mellea]|uniref:DUF6533 domain-containing protein n=1 Tax=Rickenella mellea TaxID=50990 RepID=A0A4Y7Q6Y6_9AGAM|nr:hypothetical protein BD410DRAFT_787230 [Rickenella mellea]